MSGSSTKWDPDPGTVAQLVKISKDGKIVGLQAKDAKGPMFYPTIEKIARGTPVFRHPDIQLGDELKSVNGVFMRGKSKDFVHETVRSIPPGADIEFHVIKSFKEKGFRASERGGFRVQSVRRTNPLAAMMAQGGGVDTMGSLGEEDEEVAPLQGDTLAEGMAGVTVDDSKFGAGKGFQRKQSTYGGFDAPDDPVEGSGPPPAGGGFKASTKGGFGRKQSVYGGFDAGGDDGEAGPDDDFGMDGFGDGDGDEDGFDDFNFETLDVVEEDVWG